MDPVLGVLALWSGVTAAVAWAAHRAGRRSHAPDHSVAAIGHALEALGLERARTRGGLFPRLRDVAFEGRLDGRDARVGFIDGPSPHVRIAVTAAAPLRLSITRDTLLELLASRLGWARDFDLGPLHLETSDVARSRRALKGNVREAIRDLFAAYPIDRLELGEGHLEAHVPYFALDPARFGGLLGLLDVIASGFDRVELRVRVLGGVRSALCVRGGRARCAYCHASIDGQEPDLVACSRCATVLHDGCWHELGRCPVLGCEGHVPERSS